MAVNGIIGNIDPEGIVKQYIDAKDNHRWDELVSLLDPGYTSTDPAIPEPVKGIQAISQYFPMLEHVYMKTDILMMASKGNDVAAELAVTCTFKDPEDAGQTGSAGPSFVVKMAKFYKVNSRGLLVDEREYSNPAAKFASLGPEAAAEFQAIGGDAEKNYRSFTGDVAANFEVPGPAPTTLKPEQAAGSALRSIFETRIPANLKSNAGKLAGTKGICQFTITGASGGSWYIDLNTSPATVTAGTSKAARCTITCADDEFIKIVTGKANADLAVITGKLKISGDLGLAGVIRIIIN